MMTFVEAFHLVVTGGCFEGVSNGHSPTIHLHIVPRSKVNGTIPSRCHTPASRGAAFVEMIFVCEMQNSMASCV